MTDIPTPVVTIAVGVTVATIIALSTWAIRTVRRASTVVGANGKLQEAVDALSKCNTALEAQVSSLEATVESQAKRITELERIIRDWQTIEHVRSPRRRAAT